MTTIDYQTESVRYGLKALVADLEHEKRHADAMHALAALTEIEKIAPLNIVPLHIASTATVCGARYIER